MPVHNNRPLFSILLFGCFSGLVGCLPTRANEDISIEDSDGDTADSFGEQAAVSFAAPWTEDGAADDVVGFRFTVGDSALEVAALGFFDAEADGLGEAHPVGVFGWESAESVLSATVPAGEDADYQDGFRYVDVSGQAVTLEPNTSYIALGYRPSGVDVIAYAVSDFSVSDWISYEQNVAANEAGGLVYADENFGTDTGWFGPNLLLSR